MKKTVCILLCCCLCLSFLFGCGSEPVPTVSTETTVETTAPTEAVEDLTGPEALQGKRVIFIGNSYSFCGYTVMGGDCNIVLQKDRENDQGIFYQLCKANGIDVSVTNWTFGSHSITDFFDGYCKAGRECDGIDHEIHLTDPYFDYVVLQCHVEKGYSGDFVEYLKSEMDFFRQHNPNVKFIMHVPHMAHHKNNAWVKDLDQLAKAGVKIADWGGLIDDILKGNVEVPGATQEYSFHTFVINWREDDGFHQNILCGYLTALMVYCAITGEKAEGQPWRFTNDPTLHPKLDWQKSKALHYSYNDETNFIEVLDSDADMLGLQQLADRYLAKFNHPN